MNSTQHMTNVLGELLEENPFEQAYIDRWLRWYNAKPYEDPQAGLRIFLRSVDLPVEDYFNKYWGKPYEVPVLYLGDTLWMSLTRMELQSQHLAIITAHGDVACAGLGLGYAAMRMAQRDAVSSMTVFEQSVAVIKYFKRKFRWRKGFDKIRIVAGDARQTLAKQRKEYDFIYADIYPTLLDDAAVEDVKLFAPALRGPLSLKNYMFWGWERAALDGYVHLGVDYAGRLPPRFFALMATWTKTPYAQDDQRMQGTVLSDLYAPRTDDPYARRVLRRFNRVS